MYLIGSLLNNLREASLSYNFYEEFLILQSKSYFVNNYCLI